MDDKKAMQELMDRLQDHDTYFQYCLKIQELGTKNLIPFVMNPVQKILHGIAPVSYTHLTLPTTPYV